MLSSICSIIAGSGTPPGGIGGIGGIGGVRVVEAPQSASTVGLNLPTNLARLFMLTQVLTVAVLTFLIVAMLYVSYRVNSNATYYYYAAEPYLNELANHSMSIMRHADNSSAHFETIMSNGEELAAGSAPALLDSVNATTAMVSHFQELVHNPTIRLSLG